MIFTVKRDIRNRFIICYLIGVYLTYSLGQIFFHKRSLKLFRQRRFFFVGVGTILFRRRIFPCILRLFHTTIIPVCRYFNRKTTKKEYYVCNSTLKNADFRYNRRYFCCFLQYYITKHCKYYITLFDNNFTRNPFVGLAPERARLENSLIYVIVIPSVPRHDILRKCNKQFTSPPLIRHYATHSPRGRRL